MNAPDTAIGKRIKCPKCAEAFVIDDESEEVAPLKRKSRLVEVDDDDDFDAPEPKSRKRKKKPAARVPIGVWIGAGVATWLLIGGGVYYAIRSGKSVAKPAATSVPVVAGKSGSISDLKIAPLVSEADREIRWVPFTAPDSSFTTAFPEGLPEHSSNAIAAAYTRIVGQRNYTILSITLFAAEAQGAKSAPEVYAESLLNKLKIGEEDETGKIISIERTTVAGIVAVKTLGLTMGKATVKCCFYMHDSYFSLIVAGEASMTATDRHVVAFQNKFTKGS